MNPPGILALESLPTARFGPPATLHSRRGCIPHTLVLTAPILWGGPPNTDTPGAGIEWGAERRRSARELRRLERAAERLKMVTLFGHCWFMSWSRHFMLVRYGIARMDIISNAPFRRVTFAVAGIGCVLVSAASASPASGATSHELSGSANQILKAAIASASEAGSVRVTVHFFSGKTTGELIQDSARKSAEQTVAIGKERVFDRSVKRYCVFFGK